MFVFFTFDATILLAFILLGVLVLGGSIKEVASFIVDEIHIVYPVFVAVLAVFMLIYYATKKLSIKSVDNSRLRKEWNLALDRRIIVFIINSPLVVLSPISAIQSLATYIHEMGFGGFIIALMMSFVFLLAVYIIFWLFIKAWEWADEKDTNFGRVKMFFVSLSFLVLQYILFIITQTK